MNRLISLSNIIAVILITIVGFVLPACNGGGGGTGDGGSQAETPATAEFTMTEETGNAPLNVYFDASPSSSTAGEITSYSWNFGDGSTGSGQAMSHVYNQQGTFSATLEINDASGNQATASHTITVSAPPASCSVSGTIQIASGSIADSDTNDPNSPQTSNNTFETAQQITSPITLGGYVNEQFSGESGQSFAQGDQSDIFAVSLSGNETISLSFPSSITTDLDLYLYDESFTIVDSSKKYNGVESLQVTSAGTYYIRVYAYNGASSYILTLGQNLATEAANTSLRLSQNFVPGDVIVCFRDEGSAKSLSGESTAYPSGKPVLIRLDGETSDASARAYASVLEAAAMDSINRKTEALIPGASETLLLKDRTLNLIKELNKQDSVLYAEPNYLRKPFSIEPDDPHYSRQWHYPLINLPQAWETSTGSSDVIVAVIDTGVLVSHPDLKDQLVQGYDFISGPDNALDGDGIDDNPDDPGDTSAGSSGNFHGTHVSGTIAAASNNGIGVSGIAWGSRIMPLRVLGLYGGTTYDIIQALRYAGGLENDSGTYPSQPADIINMSFGSTEYSQAEYSVITTLKEAGIILVAAAGNESTSQKAYPAAYSGVFAVGAATITKTAAWYSNYGSWIDLVAPGGDTSLDFDGDGYSDGILSTDGHSSGGSISFLYTYLQGTSMASPHLAGVLALMKSVNSQLDADSVEYLLTGMNMTDDLGVSGKDDKYGYGIINAEKAVASALDLVDGSLEPTDPVLVISPESLNFGISASSLTLTASNGGDGDLSMTSPSSETSWLTIAPITVNENNLGTYRVTVDRTGLTDGESYSASLVFQSSANTVTVPVSLYQPGTTVGTPDLGTHYIQIQNNENGQVYEVQANAQDGTYTYTFTGVPPGIYWIYAGNDPDNDWTILGNWEASGGYQTLESPTLIYVNQDKTGIDFYTGYGFAISAEAQEVSNTQIRLEAIRQTASGN